MGNNTNIWLVGAIALLIGGLFSYAFLGKTETINVPGEDIIKEVAGPIQYVNQTVEVEVPSAEAFLTGAIADAWDEELSDDDSFLTCGGVEYDEDEVTLSKIKQWGYAWFDEDEYDVGYTAKFKFDSSDDDDRCTVTRDVFVHYEDGEDPVIRWN